MEIKDITFAYQDNVKRLKEVSAEIQEGKITTILGPNGSGKSTLLGVLTNNYAPQEGNVILNGKMLNQYKPKELAKILGVVHQQNTAPEGITVEKLVNYGRLPYRTAFTARADKDEEMVKWAIERTGLTEKKTAPLHTLSGGQQQRAWIALALAQDTPYLFLDEPTSNLDIFYQYEILDLVKQLREEQALTIVMVLHDINQSIQYSDQIITMKQGQIIKIGKPEEIITADLMEEVYGVHVIVKQDPELGMYIVPTGI